MIETKGKNSTILGGMPIATLKKWAAGFVPPTAVGIFFLCAMTDYLFVADAAHMALSIIWTCAALIVFVAIPTVLHFMCLDELIGRARNSDAKAIEALKAVGMDLPIIIAQNPVTK